ncbi:replication factor C subunit 5-like [Halichondria panicea]|uniref:replication factor C subunit 5-like n=1 Tax=Halichondria panicea TaxID=6063 RepID=UPI00312B683E
MAAEEVRPKSQNLPWVEKYRPKHLDDLISHKEIITTIQRFMTEDRLPHLLFYGPPGTGKTSTILACAKMLYKPKEFNSMVLELNASDDRGIGIVRGQILSFASTRTIFRSGFKMIILDEADAMTNDAQNALRRVIEKYTENVRFCLICNYLSKIIPALQSRCTRFRFGPLSSEQMMLRLEYVIQQEALKVSADGMDSLVRLSQGDMRRSLNILQSTSMSHDEVNEATVYSVTGQPLPNDIAKIVEWMLNENFTTAYENVLKLKTLKGLALVDILQLVHTYVQRIDFPPIVKMTLLEKMADLEYNLSVGAAEKIQLGGLLGAFQITRDIVTEQNTS